MIVIILSFIILIAAGSIMGILVMMVIEKTRDIGVLRSMGMSAARTTAVFWTAGSTLGFLGVGLGLAGGVAIVKNLNAITDWLHDSFGVEVFNSKIYKFKEIPAALLPEWVAGVAIGAFLCAVVASLIPAWYASRLDPVKCLKHE
jgi:lipoprotein-releasing system permease protein